MAIHLLRDYVTQNTTTGNRTFISAYLLAIFLRRVLGYTYVGDTNYPINATGTLLIATGDTTPTVAPTFPGGNKAGINFSGANFDVSIPIGVRPVVAADVGRILVLKSTLFPLRNSGIFLITGVNLGNSTTIAAGSNGQSLPQGTINVVSTTGFPASGTIFVTTSAGGQTVTYTGTNATQFTGCSGGTGTMSTGGAVSNLNRYVIDYRGNGDTPPPEAADTLPWYLYEKDLNCPVRGTGNSGTGTSYRSYGTATTPRIILQSPHATGWQVRICLENSVDSETNFITNIMTAAPGFGGNSAGDFAVGGQHLHGALFNDFGQTSYTYNTGTGFGDNLVSGPIMRITMIGDDGGQSLSIVARRPLNATSPPSFYHSFGIPDNEPLPLQTNNTRRLYSLGNGVGNASGNGRTNDVSLGVGHTINLGTIQGASFWDVPVSCSPSLLCYLTSNAQLAGPTFDASAGDCPFTSSTELVPVDLVAGVVGSWSDVSVPQGFPYVPRVMGTLPFIRNGRTNFGDYTLSTDSETKSVSAATNATPIQITTSTTNTLVTGQTVAIHSVGGNTAANGTWVVTVLNNTQFTLNGSVGNGTYTSGGTVLRGASFQHMRRGIYMLWNGPSVVP